MRIFVFHSFRVSTQAAASSFGDAVRVLHRHLTAGRAVNFARDIAGLVAGQEDKNRSELGRLSGSPEYRLGAELFFLLFWQRGGNKRSPDRTRSYGVDPHALF